MTALVTLGLRLARAGGALRSSSIIAGNAIGTFLVLVAVAIPPALYPDPKDREAAVVTLVAALAFLLAPGLILLITVGRLSSGLRDRRLAALRLLGVSTGRTRIVAAVENGCLAVVGALVGIAVFLLAAPVAEGAIQRGPQWLRAPLAVAPGTTALIGAGIVALSVLVGTAPSWTRELPTAARSESRRRTPSPWRLLLFAVGPAVLIYVGRTPRTPGDETRLALALLAGTALLALGIALATPLVVSLIARLVLRRPQPVWLTLGARSIQADAAGATRVVAGLGVAVFLVTGAFGFIGMNENLPHLRAALRAYGDGPQVITLTQKGDATKAPDLAALADVPGVRGVVPQREVLGGCDQTYSCEVFIGTCAELGLFQEVTGCRDDHAAAITDDLTGVADQYLTGRRPRAVPDELTLTFVPPEGGGETLGSVDVDGAPITRALARQADVWSNTGQVAAFVPAHLIPDLPAATTFDVIADGGRDVEQRIITWADAHGLHARQDTARNYRSVQQVRAFTYALCGIALAVALMALGLTATDRALERRRAVARQVMVGVPAGVLRKGQVLQTLVPSLVSGGLALAAGVLVAWGFTHLLGEHAIIGTGRWVMLGAVVATGAVLVSLSTLPLIRTQVTPDLLRRE